VIEADAETAARAAARRIADRVRARPESTLALAAGSTMVPVYQALVEIAAAERIPFARVRAFDLDEYVGVAPDDPRSFRRFLRDHLLERLAVPPERHDAPDGLALDLAAECARYEAAITHAGGLDLALLGLGRNAHLAFNEPGASLDGRTRVELLQPDSRKRDLPRLAITMGLGTIRDARALLLVALGAEKTRAVADALEGTVTPQVPASVLQLHPDATVVLDEEAAAGLGEGAWRSSSKRGP
jgi:glucosamine-6-phosphate deaminase